jgi:hypothetical protein
MHETLMTDDIDHKNTIVHMWVKCDNTNETKKKLDVIFNISETHTKHENIIVNENLHTRLTTWIKFYDGLNCVHSSNSPY